MLEPHGYRRYIQPCAQPIGRDELPLMLVSLHCIPTDSRYSIKRRTQLFALLHRPKHDASGRHENESARNRVGAEADGGRFTPVSNAHHISLAIN